MSGEDAALARAVIERVRAALEAAADPQRAAPMAAYMKGHGEFLGVPAPDRRRLVRAALRGVPPRSLDAAVAVADACWALPEREYQYTGAEELADAVHRHVRQCDEPGARWLLTVAERLITTRAWWDTVDHLCRHVAGETVRAHPSVGRPVMDRWVASGDVWLVRSALLHQERWGASTDEGWLFDACARRAGDRDFFVRKAIGWALRSYAHTGPGQADAVRRFLAAEGAGLAPLSRREAMRRVRH